MAVWFSTCWSLLPSNMHTHTHTCTHTYTHSHAYTYTHSDTLSPLTLSENRTESLTASICCVFLVLSRIEKVVFCLECFCYSWIREQCSVGFMNILMMVCSEHIYSLLSVKKSEKKTEKKGALETQLQREKNWIQF